MKKSIRKKSVRLSIAQKVGLIVLITLPILVCVVVLMIIVGAGSYAYAIRSQSKAGQNYLDSITETDVPIWIERTKEYLEEREAGTDWISHEDIPPDLKTLKIIQIHVGDDYVQYVWVGGFEHTHLLVERTEEGEFIVTARYSDFSSKVIWPREQKTE